MSSEFQMKNNVKKEAPDCLGVQDNNSFSAETGVHVF